MISDISTIQKLQEEKAQHFRKLKTTKCLSSIRLYFSLLKMLSVNSAVKVFNLQVSTQGIVQNLYLIDPIP